MSIDSISTELLLFFLLYGGTTVAALIACLYLLFCKGNAFVEGVTPPERLRLWAAAFFAVVFLGHIWWLLFYLYSGDFNSVTCMVVCILDGMTLMTTIPGTLFAMLQDRRRTVWPIIMATIPYAVLLELSLVYPDRHFTQIALAYVLFLYVAFTVYMIIAVRQYGRWLRDNYADLEHKEVMISYVMIIAILLLIVTYGFDNDNLTISYFVQGTELVLIGLMLWRVETLPKLEEVSLETLEYAEPEIQQPTAIPSNIEQLLEEHCVATKLYLQNDLTLLQLAQAIGTNRFYLSQYFSRQGITYNAYINNLRINHFVNLYREAIAAQKPVTAQQLASDSGYRSYSTFSLAFKQRMGESVTAWMHEMAV